MNGFRVCSFSKIPLLILLALFVYPAAGVHADTAFQSQGFDQGDLPGTFMLKLDLYPSSSSGPLTGGLGGGAFKATIKSGPLQSTAFPTFCLEYPEHFSPGTTYTATIEPDAIYGGNGGALPADASHPYTYDPVGSATQLLYRTFLTGALSGAVSGFSYSVQSSYTALQTAIWSLEQESWGANLTALASSLKQWAVSNADGGDYGVRALNLWTNNTPYTPATKVQSQLIWVRVAEPRSIVLLGASLIAVVLKMQYGKRRSAGKGL